MARAKRPDSGGAKAPARPEPDALLRFVERLAMVMADAGIPRMPARVYAYVLAEDANRYTARELAEGLGVSPAAISGAIRYLIQVGLLQRRREPGARADHYVIDDDDLWSSVILGRATLLENWESALAEGADELGDRPGGRRLREAQEFFAFLRHDIEGTMERWKQHRADHELGARTPRR